MLLLPIRHRAPQLGTSCRSDRTTSRSWFTWFGTIWQTAADGTQLCQARDLIDIVLKAPIATQKLLADGHVEHVWFELGWEPPDDLSGNPIFVEKLDPKRLRQIESLRISGPCKFTMTPLGLRRGKLGDVHVAWATASVGGQKAMIVATRDVGGAEKLTVHTYPTEQGRNGAQ